MEAMKDVLASDCSSAGVRPIMVDLPYPKIQVKEKNMAYANLLSVDYCGSVSELSAITQYIGHESSLFQEKCPIARTLLGIAMAEMMHLQKLGELIVLLGGCIDFAAKQQNGKKMMWTPAYLSLPMQLGQMIAADMDAERAAIHQYRMHIRAIQDPYIRAVLERIILDEEYHIMILKAMQR